MKFRLNVSIFLQLLVAPGVNLLHESVSGASSLVCIEICLP